MTFTEAAAQVLRLVGKPLHYKDITEIALEQDLLSHVGKSPDVTMGARLAAVVKKGEKDTPLVRLKPGVFALSEWDQATIDAGLADRTPTAELIKRRAAALAAAEPGEARTAVPSGSPVETQAGQLQAGQLQLGQVQATPALRQGPSRPSERPALDAEERERAERALTAGKLFEEEDDDDVPIFGAPEAEVVAVERGGEDGEGADAEARRRRRRRRRGKGGDRPEDRDDLPGYTVSDAPESVGAEAADAEEGEEGGEDWQAEEAPTLVGGDGGRPAPERAGRERGDLERGRGDLDRGRHERGDVERGPRDRGEVERGARDRGERDRGERDRNGRERGARERGGEERGERAVGALEQLEGEALADALETLLAGLERQGGAGLRQLVELARRQGGWSADPQHVQAAIVAAIRADNLRRAARQRLERFHFVGGRVSLTSWSLAPEARRLEAEIQERVERSREATTRTLLSRLRALPPRAVGELVMVLLEAHGVGALRLTRRNGTSAAGELHLSGRAEGPGGAQSIAIVVRRDGRDLGRERVVEARGSLHHYEGARAAWMLTTGQVLSGAREEAAVEGATPVRLTDGQGLAKLCVEHGIGVQKTLIALSHVDSEFFDSLKVG